jgi:hypothetical protein
MPILAVLGYPFAPRELRRFAWAILPLWIVIHAYYSVMAETRLFLVPLTVVLIPLALCGLEGRGQIYASSTNSGEYPS